MNLKTQSGRSMVEMLGTLAIIGVLSIGGIAGYSYGMDKYRANETINDILLRSVEIMTNINQERNPNDSGWPSENPIGYPISFVKDTTNRYGIQIQNIPSRICKIVGDAMKDIAIVYVGTEDYNSNTEADPCDESDKNTMEFYFETLECTPECANDEICVWGECVYDRIEYTKWKDGDGYCSTSDGCGPCGTCDNNWCSPIFGGKSCTTDTVSNGMCYWGDCLPQNGCNDKAPCTKRGEYCASLKSNETEPFPDNSTGVCVKADYRKININNKTYYVSNTTMNWWDANAFCQTLDSNGLLSENELRSIESDLHKEAQRQGIDAYFWSNTSSGNAIFILRSDYNWNQTSTGGISKNYFALALCK